MKKIFLLASIAFASFSCTTDDEIKASEQFNSSPKTVGFENGSQSASFFTNQGQVSQDFILNFLGGGNGRVSDVDIFVNYTISYPPTPTGPGQITPAVENDEFNFVDTTGKIKIPAGTTFGLYPLKINTANLDRFKKTQMIVTLTSASNGVVVSKNHDTLLVNFVGCESLLAGTTYTVVVERNNGTIRTYTAEAISLLSTNIFRTRTTGQWAFGTIAAGSSGQGYDFEDICGNINLLKDQTLFRYYSNKVKGLGFYGGNDGQVISNNNFRVRYAISPLGAADAEFLATYTRP